MKEILTFECLYDWAFECIDGKGYGIEQFMKNVSIDTLRPMGNLKIENNPRNRGFVPVRHYLSNGDRTVSWYRGPFSPEKIELEPFHTSGFAVERISYDKDLGMFDVSYSSAWQLGRLLALSDVKYATQLLKENRKRSNKKFDKIKDANSDYFYDINNMLIDLSSRLVKSPQNSGKINYVFSESESGKDSCNRVLKKRIEKRKGKKHEKRHQSEEYEYSELIMKTLSRWAAFYDIPFEWLFPNESLITDESVNLFMIDPNWHKSLLDGALSLGRYSEYEIERRAKSDGQLINAAMISGKEHRKKLLNEMRGMKQRVDYECFSLDEDVLNSKVQETEMSGLLINSRLISDNPGLEIHFFDKFTDGRLLEEELKIVRMERIKPSLLLCIVEGTIKSVVFDMPFEGLNYGCQNKSKIILRNLETGVVNGLEIDLSFHEDGLSVQERCGSLFERGRIDFKACSEKMEEKLKGRVTSAELAMEFTVSRCRGVMNFERKIFDGSNETSDSIC